MGFARRRPALLAEVGGLAGSSETPQVNRPGLRPSLRAAGLFDGDRSRYVHRAEGLHELLLEQFGDWYLELQDEIDLFLDSEEPRTLAQIVEAEQEYFDRVWYVRNWVHYDQDHPGWQEARERTEAKYGRESLHEAIGPGHDPAWEYGYISGKLATLRWVLGSEWDFLDT